MADRRALVLGAAGFVGGHLCAWLVRQGWQVTGVNLVWPQFREPAAQSFRIADLRDPAAVERAIDDSFDAVFQLAADMGGAGYIFSGDNDAAIMRNSALINLNVLERIHQVGAERVLYTSSACVYPEHNQEDATSPVTAEDSAYPAAPDSEYGWEKLFSERLFQAYGRNYGIDIKIARLHNVFGPYGAWTGGREKAPAAICRKVALASSGDQIEVWGDGRQTRSFLYVDECVEALLRFVDSPHRGPLNIGSEEMVSINELVSIITEIAGKDLSIRHVQGPRGVAGRTSDNRLIRELLGWSPSTPLRVGLERTYAWIEQQVRSTRSGCQGASLGAPTRAS